jgi:hypothetical protein
MAAGCGGSGNGEAGWQDAPIVPEISGELKDRFLSDVEVADAAGQNPLVFAKVGDSNTEIPGNLYGFACRPVEYGENADVEPVVERYDQVEFELAAQPDCLPVTSFSRFSAATRSGSFSVFPVSNLPPIWVPQTRDIDEYGAVKTANAAIADLAEAVEVPLINLWAAMEEDQMIEHGLSRRLPPQRLWR